MFHAIILRGPFKTREQASKAAVHFSREDPAKVLLVTVRKAAVLRP